MYEKVQVLQVFSKCLSNSLKNECFWSKIVISRVGGGGGRRHTHKHANALVVWDVGGGGCLEGLGGSEGGGRRLGGWSSLMSSTQVGRRTNTGSGMRRGCGAVRALVTTPWLSCLWQSLVRCLRVGLQWIHVHASVPVVSGPHFHVPLVSGSHLFGVCAA